MTESVIIPCDFDGAVFTPRPGFLKRAQGAFGEGEIVTMEIHYERSGKTHRHQFAAVKDIWDNLPESLAEAPYAMSAETLRKHALIVTGYADVLTVDAGSKAAAERMGAALGVLGIKAHGYAISKVQGCVVRLWTPHSQSYRAMGKALFQKSKSDVLDWCSALIEAPTQETKE